MELELAKHRRAYIWVDRFTDEFAEACRFVKELSFGWNRFALKPTARCELARIKEIAIGLADLDLPVLVVLEICKQAQQFPDDAPTYHTQWQIAKLVKHFDD